MAKPDGKFWGATKILVPIKLPDAVVTAWLVRRSNIFTVVPTWQAIQKIGFEGPNHPSSVITAPEQETNKVP